MSQQAKNISEAQAGELPAVLYCSHCKAVLNMGQTALDTTQMNPSADSNAAPTTKTTKTAKTILPRYFPFCSERCRVLDLGAWASGGHAIAGASGDAAYAIEEVDSL